MKYEKERKIIIGQIGVGGWGPNLLRNFSALPDCVVKVCCDLDAGNLAKARQINPAVETVTDYDQLLKDREIEAIVVATPVPTHFELARRALEAGKHVFVEKPIAMKVDEAEKMVELARQVGKKLMVGHLLLYHAAIRKLKSLIEAGELGEILSVYAQRLNLGTIRSAENALWSLAPHDISVILHLISSPPRRVSALGGAFVQPGIEDTVFFLTKFDNGAIASVHVSWLDPTKTRKTVVVGSKKMAIFDELSGSGSLTLYDKGFKNDLPGKIIVRSGEGNIVELENKEPLKSECQHFIECIRDNKDPLTDGNNGVEVLSVLEAAQRSLEGGGNSELL
jgi:predicted dehydrogenase